MTAESFIKRIADLAKRFNAAMAGIQEKAQKYYPNFSSFQIEIQKAKLEQARGFVVDDFKAEAEKLQQDAAKAKAELPLEIDKAKFPLLTSSGKDDRLLGEMQLNTARLFLSTEPKPEALVSEIRSALTLKRMDAAWMLLDHAQQSIPKDSTLNPDQVALRDGLRGLAFSDPKIDELEAELAAWPDLERLAGELVRQVSAGAEILFLPDIMTEAEIEAAKGTPQYNLSEHIVSQKRKEAVKREQDARGIFR